MSQDFTNFHDLEFPSHFWRQLNVFEDSQYLSNEVQKVQDFVKSKQSGISTEKKGFKNDFNPYLTHDGISGQQEAAQSTANSSEKSQEKIKQKFEDRYLNEKKTFQQNRNTIKFMMRLFLKYHSKFAKRGEETERRQEVSEVYKRLYKRKQSKINLTIYKKLLKDSQFSLRNRLIFTQILSSRQVLKNELLFNGNVKRKLEYYSTCKIMKIRCLSATLCQRTECR